MKNLNDNETLTIVIVLYKEPFELIYKTIDQINSQLNTMTADAHEAPSDQGQSVIAQWFQSISTSIFGSGTGREP